jgi:hypothetical protein
MKKQQNKKEQFSLGDLIAELFEQAKHHTSNRLEQNLMVYVALRDLLQRRVRVARPIALRS